MYLIHQRHPKKLFLLDSAGAFLTACLLRFVLSPWEEYFGMPRTVLNVLALIAVAFSVYSLCCYFLAGERWRLFLNIICVANLLYCCATLGLLIYFYPRLTKLGIAYFVIEIIVICGLVVVERKASASAGRK